MLLEIKLKVAAIILSDLKKKGTNTEGCTETLLLLSEIHFQIELLLPSGRTTILGSVSLSIILIQTLDEREQGSEPCQSGIPNSRHTHSWGNHFREP